MAKTTTKIILLRSFQKRSSIEVLHFFSVNVGMLFGLECKRRRSAEAVFGRNEVFRIFIH